MCAKVAPGMTEEDRDSVVPEPAARSITAVSRVVDERIESEMDAENHLAAESLKVGDLHHRAFIGPPDWLDPRRTAVKNPRPPIFSGAFLRTES